MPDKIDPGWVSDRLPTRKDGDKDGSVLVLYPDKKYITTWQSEDVTQSYVDNGLIWALFKDEWSDKSRPCSEWIATPTECEARAKGEDGMDAYDKARKPLQDLLEETQGTLHEEREKIKELETELKQVKEENKDLAKAWKTLKDFNDNTDNQEDEEIEELKQALAESKSDSEFDHKEYKRLRDELKEKLAKSEEDLKELKKSYNWYVDERDELLPENKTLKKLLIKEWE